MKVLVVSPDIRPGGGPAGYTYNLRRALRDHANRVHNSFVFCGRSSEERSSLLQSSMSSRRLLSHAIHGANSISRGSVRKSRNFYQALVSSHGREVRSAIRSADLVVFQGFQAAYLARYAAKLDRGVVYMPHSPTPIAHERSMLAANSGTMLPGWQMRSFQQEEAELFKVADACIFPSEGAMGPYQLDFGRELASREICLIPSGVPDPTPSAPPNLGSGGSKPIFFVGRYVSHKGYDLFCDAARLLSQDPTWKHPFVSIGTGPLEPNDFVVDLGWQQKPHDLMASAEAIVVANRISYYDLLPLEAAGLGLPLVMTPVGGNVDQAKLLPAAVLAAHATADGIANAIRDCVRLNTSTVHWGNGNRRAYEQHFTLARLASNWDQAISRLG